MYINNLLSTLLLFFFVSSVLSQAQNQTFVGTWTDQTSFRSADNPGRTYVCVEGNRLYASFSEFGVAQGTILGATVTGLYFKPGGDKYFRFPSFGTFVWTLSLDGSGWRGVYSRDGSTETIEWNEQRVDFEEPTDLECAKLSGEIEADVQGTWVNDRITKDICVYGGVAFDSSSLLYRDTRGVGYQQGTCHVNNGLVASGYFAQNYNIAESGSAEYNPDYYTEGIVLSILIRDGSLLTYMWETPGGDFPAITGNHVTVIANRVATNVTNCSRYEYVVEKETDSYVAIPRSSSNSNNSAAASLSAGIIIFVIVFASLL